jgi:hypothetical protein
MDEHPGGRAFLTTYVGKDATTAVFGGVYEHSNAAHNVCLLLYPSFAVLTVFDAAVGDDARRSAVWRDRTRYGSCDPSISETADHRTRERELMQLAADKSYVLYPFPS